jgi:hypothetical protein
VRNTLSLLVVSLLVSGSAASAQEPIPSPLAFPGSFWISAGNAGPAEPGNTIGQASLEQGLTVWHEGSWFLTPFINASLTTDSRGYEWNDKHPFTVAAKLQRRTSNGVIYAGAGIMFEHDPVSGRDRHPTAFAGYWSGWQLDARAHVGASPFSLPGSVNVMSGLLTGRDPDNWMSSVSVQQGVRVFRVKGIAAVPYGSVRVSIDTKDRPWENRATSDAGVKVVRAITGGTIEAGVAQRFQRELKSGRQASEPVAFVNLWIGWNPSATGSR